MTTEEILAKVKTDLRFDFNDLDGDLADNITAALYDLRAAGVNSDPAVMDEIVLAAVKHYCRNKYNFDGRAEQYERAYIALKVALSLDPDHKLVSLI